MRRLTRGSTGAAAGLLVAIALSVGAFVSDVDDATRSVVIVLGALVLLMAGYKLLRTRTGSAKTDRSGSTRTARNERDAKQRAAAAASGQALPAQLQRRSRRQSVSGLLPTSGDEGE
jgi:threonine/homoserine/homoserine lactone efflux protein